jgi:hypothetical protein
MARLADMLNTKRWASRKQLLEMGLLRDEEGRRLVPLDLVEVEQRLKSRKIEES